MIENPTIVIPGLTGSSLENHYPLEPRATWSEAGAVRLFTLGPQLDELALDPTGRFDRGLEVVTRPHGLLPLAYGSLVRSLRSRRQLPVYVCPYDWRCSVAQAAESLAELVAAVHAKVTAAHPPGWQQQIDFVCHSMGGLVFRSFLGRYPQLEHIGRVIFLAVPQRGSLDAVEAMIRGQTTLLGGRKEMRKLVRTFPGVYELLPRFAGALVDPAGADLSPFSLDSWQQNVTPERRAGPEPHGFGVLPQHLDSAQAVLAGLADPVACLDAGAILTVYGSWADSTLVSIPVGPPPERDYDFCRAIQGYGDGVVPACSALLEGVPAVKLTRGDASYFTEPTAALSFHAFIGSLDETQSVVARFLGGASQPEQLLPRGLPADRYDPAPDPTAPA